MKKVLLLGISWRLLQFMTLLLKLSRTVAGCLICVCFACGLIFFYCESGKLYFMECSSDVWINEIEICSLLFPKLFFLFFYSSFQSRSCFLYCILKIRFVLPKSVLIWKMSGRCLFCFWRLIPGNQTSLYFCFSKDFQVSPQLETVISYKS